MNQPLQADTRYWIALIYANNTGGTNSVFWAYNDGGTAVGSAADEYLIFCPDGTCVTDPNSDGPYQMKVLAEVGTVPLPATLPLFAIGAGFIGLLLYRRKRHTALA